MSTLSQVSSWCRGDENQGLSLAPALVWECPQEFSELHSGGKRCSLSQLAPGLAGKQ